MKYLPIALIYSRLIIGALLVTLSLMNTSHYAPIAISLLTFGLLSDIFDGIIARRLGISTEKLRRLDSAVDGIFWILVMLSVFIRYPEFFMANWMPLASIIALEALTYIISYARFGKEVATHAIASKIWVLLMFATLIEIMISGNSGFLFWLCIGVGIITRLEIIAILLLLRTWTNDVPSVIHAVGLRQGREIKRNKLFNG